MKARCKVRGPDSVRVRPTSAACSLGLVLLLAACSPSIDFTPTGEPVAGMEGLDRFMIDFMTRWDGVGGSLAISKDGRLVFARGYGLADIEARQPVAPDSLFRIGSVSKFLTAVGILRLVEQGRVDIDAPAFSLLTRLQPPPSQTPDPRLGKMTVRRLLNHTGGWDAGRSGDPISRAFGYTIASTLGVSAPPDAEAIVRYMFGRPLDFDPGTNYAYSNAGYIVLGRILEEVSGMRYEEFVQQSVLSPMGIGRMRLGNTRLAERAPSEVRYYDFPRTPLVRSVFPEDRGLVPYGYGGVYLEADDASGGWLGSPADLLRFVSALDGRRAPAFFKPETVSLMEECPPIYSASGSVWHGQGPVILREEGGLAWNHDGSVASDWTSLIRHANGVSWAVSFSRHGMDETAFRKELYEGIESALAQVMAWPDHDLSPAFFSDGP